MGQSRNKTGIENEILICKEKGWKKVSKSPRIKWTGTGRSNFDKIHSVGYDASKFKPTFMSVYEKYDAIKPNGEKVEIKGYLFKNIRNKWITYSEPIFKVSSPASVTKVIKLFGDGNQEKAIDKYNSFVESMMGEVGQEILEKITLSNIGIQLEDVFVPQSMLEYRWNILKSAWKGFYRLEIQFRIKDKS